VELRDARVVVTGGAGAIGSHVVDLLVAEGADVVVFDCLATGAALDNLKDALTTGLVELVRGDLRDAAAVEQACQGADFVFHLAAARIDQCRARPDLALGVNITGTFNVLQAALGAGVQKVVYASAGAAYGEPRYVPVDEEHPLEPLGLYAASKAAGEHLGVGFHVEHGLPFIALRFFNIYGPRHDHAGNRSQIIPSWLACLEEGKPPRIFGDGSQTMDFVYIADAARAMLVAAQSDRSLGAYNVCRGIETSAAQLADILIDLTGSSLRPVFEQGNGAGVRRRCGSPVRAEAELGFRAEVEIEEGLQATIAWRRALCQAA
jgi:UDP-glucose 4-epimerase